MSTNPAQASDNGDQSRPKPGRLSRRTALQVGGALAASFSIVPRHVLGGPGYVAPSERIQVGVVGVGGRGKQNVGDLLKNKDVVISAIADPAESWDLSKFYYKGTAGRVPVAEQINKHFQAETPSFQVAQYEDFRKMLDERKELDAVLCATPDHLHAYVSVTSMKAGKHMYCEKPLTHNIAEARYVAKVAKETKVATQMGNQGHSNKTMRETIEWIRAGAIGKVKEVHAWTSGSRWNPTATGKPTGGPVPKGLNWDLWIGPRSVWDFDPMLAPVAWRDFWPFGLGNLGDIGCHDLDSAVWALNLKAPTTVEVQAAGQANEDIVPHGELGYFDFEATGDQQAVKLMWYSGGIKPPLPAEVNGKPLAGRGTLFVGEKGKLLCGGAGGQQQLLPNTLGDSFKAPDASLPRSPGHHREWLDAIKGGPAPMSNFEYGARLTEIILLGCLSLRLGKQIQWDSEKMSVKNVPEAEPMIKGTYRKGWELIS
jgi:predicted dehydrogenase